LKVTLIRQVNSESLALRGVLESENYLRVLVETVEEWRVDKAQIEEEKKGNSIKLLKVMIEIEMTV